MMIKTQSELLGGCMIYQMPVLNFSSHTIVVK